MIAENLGAGFTGATGPTLLGFMLVMLSNPSGSVGLWCHLFFASISRSYVTLEVFLLCSFCDAKGFPQGTVAFFQVAGEL